MAYAAYRIFLIIHGLFSILFFHSNRSYKSRNDHDSTDDCLRGRKRGRYGEFNAAWKTLFKLRWLETVKQIKPVGCSAEHAGKSELTKDWQQMYWERHMQDCIDEAVEIALLPSFDQCIGEIKISDAVIKSIGYEGHTNNSTSDYSKLSYHCQRFGYYARCLRLQNVFCVAETCHLLRHSKLKSLVLRRIKSEEHVDGSCKLLKQNSETLRSLEFIHCKLPSTFVNAIFDSLHVRGMQTHMIQHFSVKSSSFLETNLSSLPVGLVSFLSSGRSLCSLTFSDNHFGQNFARMVFTTLLDVSSSLSMLDLSENNISGPLSNYNLTSSSFTLSSLQMSKSLQFLRVLNLRGNNLRKGDVDSFKGLLFHIPNLEVLDISDNPIEDDGIRNLIPYFVEERNPSLADLKLENCELSCNGVTQLLEIFATLKKPLDSLSIADNDLGSQVAAPLGKILGTSIKVLNIECIELGSSGLLELERGIGKESKLVHINISKNRGAIATALFMSKLISRAPELVSINAAYNFMPVESLAVISSALKVATGKFALVHIDLTGNTYCEELARASVVNEFQRNGKPIVVFSSAPAPNAPYDDDP